jgi:cellulose synthase/poly-beta-1,6-N-acetylglucosamine synthase-like glycosyltransferase
MVMDKQSKSLILVLVVLLIIISSIFMVYITYNMNSKSSYSSKQPYIHDSDKDKKDSLHVFDSPQIKVDILIPAKRNDDTAIENIEFKQIRTELATRFGGVTVLTPFNGTTIHNETRYDGVNNSGFYVVAPNTLENLEWFVNYKQTLKDRLHQDRIFVTFSPTMIAP